MKGFLVIKEELKCEQMVDGAQLVTARKIKILFKLRVKFWDIKVKYIFL